MKFARGYGVRSGETPVRGLIQDFGIEIESFKSYAPGDDIRYLDWNAVGRLDQLLTRRFVAEREIPVHVLVDASRSMGVPGADDIMLNYQSTSFHDAMYVRHVLKRRPAPEFEQWLAAR